MDIWHLFMTDLQMPFLQVCDSYFKNNLVIPFTTITHLGESSKIFNDSTTVDFWIGLNSLMAPGNWSWTDNTAFDFKDWAPKEPQNLSMNCATVTIQNGLWASSDCFKTKPYVCETITLIPPTTAPVSTTPSYPAYMNCTEGWLYFEPTHSCYGHNGYNSKAGTWTEAEQYCEKQNAHLPSLHSYDEMRFLTTTSHFTNDAGLWIGLTSNDNEVTWKWSDGSPVDYLPWGSGYPRLNVSSCVTLFNNRIYDVNCATGYYFICKKPATL